MKFVEVNWAGNKALINLKHVMFIEPGGESWCNVGLVNGRTCRINESYDDFWEVINDM
jgi:hypothetical protein